MTYIILFLVCSLISLELYQVGIETKSIKKIPKLSLSRFYNCLSKYVLFTRIQTFYTQVKVYVFTLITSIQKICVPQLALNVHSHKVFKHN